MGANGAKGLTYVLAAGALFILIAFTITNLNIDRLSRNVERLIEHLEEKKMADVNLVDGTQALDHGVPLGPWTSGTQTVQLTVYKESANETSEHLRQRVVAATAKALTDYPPNTTQ